MEWNKEKIKCILIANDICYQFIEGKFMKQMKKILMNKMNLDYIGELKGLSKFRYKKAQDSFNYVAKLFDGIYLVLTDYRDTYNYEVSGGFNIKSMNLSYCLEGQMKCQLPTTNEVSFITKHSFTVDCIAKHCAEAKFPEGHLKNLEYFISIEEISEETEKIFESFGVSIMGIYEKFGSEKVAVLKKDLGIEKIFKSFIGEEFFNVNRYRMALLETLFYLKDIQLSEENEFVYLPKKHIEKVQQVQKLITDDFRKKYTVDELASIVNISKTYLNRAFKEVYGDSIHVYLINKRIEYAKKQMRLSKISITEIAERVGYANASKFADMFRKYEGISPRVYRGGLKYDL